MALIMENLGESIRLEEDRQFRSAVIDSRFELPVGATGNLDLSTVGRFAYR
jgi:hypothetical protein